MKGMQRLTRAVDFTATEHEGAPTIEGLFITYNGEYRIGESMVERVKRGAVNLVRDRDVRCLYNHDANIVLGRTTAGTLELWEDEAGIWGRVFFNTQDAEAMNAYARIKRGDVSQCSFGFEIERENVTEENGETVFTIEALKLLEVSPVAFPAYEDTHVSARARLAKHRLEETKKSRTAWRERKYEEIKKISSVAGSTRKAK